MGLGHGRSIHVRHRLVRNATEETLEHGQGEDAVVVPRQLALVLDFQRPCCPHRQAGEQPAQTFRQRQERTHGLRSLGGRHVDGERHEVATQGQFHHFGDGFAGLVLRLAGACAQMGGDHHTGQPKQRGLGGGFGVEHVDGGAADMPRLDGSSQVGFHHDAAAGHVDDAQALFGPAQTLGVEQAHGFGGLGHVDGDEVRCGQQLVDVEQFHIDLAGPLG